MTKGEAVEILKDWDGYFIGHSSDDVNEALNMAIQALEQEPCEDAVSRAEVLNLVRFNAFHVKSQIAAIEHLSSVIPQEPKTGHWIEHPHEAGLCWEFSRYECSKCHGWAEDDSDYCPDCGAKMVEPQESEET